MYQQTTIVTASKERVNIDLVSVRIDCISQLIQCVSTGFDTQIFLRKIVNIFLPISLAHVLGAQKNCLIETVLLSTHNIYIGREIDVTHS